MSGINEFYWWEAPGGNLPSARLGDDRFLNLASMLTSDIRTDGASLLDALMLVEWARDGRRDIDEWEGDSTAAEFLPDGVAITDLGPEQKTQRYSLDEVHEALIRYWRFLFPGAAERQNALKAWARAYEQEYPDAQNPQHPCVVHLPL